ncbi:MAG: FG-GAP-like repeat-containing protein [Chitinophagaceae bacterium]|nr:FG-GAP-like repeat-containing protein [Chitinophagaceae bacterium]
MSVSIHSRKNNFNFFSPSIVILFLLTFFSSCSTKTKDNGNSIIDDPKNRALLYLSQNHLEEAAAAFQQAIKIEPRGSSSYVGLTRLYVLQKNYDDAEKIAKQGLKNLPENLDLKLLLAQIYSLKNAKESAIRVLNEILEKDPKNAIAYYKLAELDSSNANGGLRKYYLQKVHNLLPANIILRLQLAEIFASESNTDSAQYFLQSVKKIAPGFSDASEKFYQKSIFLLQGNKPLLALEFIQKFHDIMKTTPEYALGIDELEIPKMIAGYFDFVTNIPIVAYGYIPVTRGKDNAASATPLKFIDYSEIPGSIIENSPKAENAVLAIADYDAAGNMYLYSSYLIQGSSDYQSHLSVMQMGNFRECTITGGIEHKGKDFDASFADYDNDGYQDLFIANSNGIILYKNKGNGSFSKVTEDIGLRNAENINQILFADFDQDGDLDMFAARKGGNKFFRNNGDGTFSENATAMGLTGSIKGTMKMDFGDLDNDGDLDIIGLGEDGSIELFNNNRHSNFNDISEAVGLKNPKYMGTTITLGDYNNDGRLDIFIAGGLGGKCLLFRNEGSKFVLDDKMSEQISSMLIGIQVYEVSFVDYDNDGFQDIVVAGVNKDSSKRGIRLFHNDGLKKYRDVSSLLPEKLMQAYHVATADFNFDGDRDIFFAGPTGVRLARNDGGNNNNYIQVQLTGLTYGNSKNNRLGIGAQIELKSGDLYQLKTVKGPLTEFGVGARTKVDALRIIWPNGYPQTITDPTRKERLLEEAKLKGSCPLLFTWNGKKYEFVKDMLWRSALGMNVAIHGKDTIYAYSNPSKEYLKIPGDMLKPQNGLYTLKITEELWEAVYFDKAELIAIDHPDSVDAFVDERFVAPPYPGKKLYTVSHQHLPVSAIDGDGNNLLPKISNYDFNYVSNFSLGKYQGMSTDHDLILDLGKEANGDSLFLFLRGWIFPGDASINTELTQTNKYQLKSPSLQVINKEGKWQTVIKDIGYPMGRDKMVIANLTGKFLTPNDRRVRINTNMQIYWDHIFFSTGKVNAPIKMQDLKMVGAELNYRGYSASYNKGGPYGPQWFDYYNITKGQKWRDLTGNYTRYGNVLPLLQHADDEYIIADGGDEITIHFDATQLAILPKGWKRDYLIYSEGWVKDGDLNIAYGQTVEPLPFHSMPNYPYGKNVNFPTDKAHLKYQQEYNTRKVTTQEFVNAIRLGSFGNANK